MDKFSIYWTNRAMEDWLDVEVFLDNQTYSDAILMKLLKKQKFLKLSQIQAKFNERF